MCDNIQASLQTYKTGITNPKFNENTETEKRLKNTVRMLESQDLNPNNY